MAEHRKRKTFSVLSEYGTVQQSYTGTCIFISSSAHIPIVFLYDDEMYGTASEPQEYIKAIISLLDGYTICETEVLSAPTVPIPSAITA